MMRKSMVRATYLYERQTADVQYRIEQAINDEAARALAAGNQHFRELRLSHKIGDAGLSRDHRRRPRSRSHRLLFERIGESQHPLSGLVGDHGSL